MPTTPTVTLDTITGAQLDVNALQASYIRTGFVNDIDLTDLPDPDALAKVMAVSGMPVIHSSLSTNFPQLKLVSVRIRPELAMKGRRANLELRYETNVANFTPTAYLLRDRTYAQPRHTCFIPGARTPVVTSFVSLATTGLRVPDDMVFFDIDVAVRAIQLVVLQYGRPDGGTANYINYVNDSDWPTGDFAFNQFSYSVSVKTATSLPRAYWKLNNYSTEYNRNAGMTLVQSEAVTQVIEDWSSVGMLVDQRTGKYPFAGLDASTRGLIFNSMMAPDYIHDVIWPPPGTPAPAGIIRIGPYPTTGFPALFGF